MHNTTKMVEAGRQAIKRNPCRDALTFDFMEARGAGWGDNWRGILDSYFLGVAVGMRIAEVEKKGKSQRGTK